MDNLTHLTLGGVLGGLASFRKLGKKGFYRGMLLANVPDLDVIVGPLVYGSGIHAEFFHRGMFHSILFGLFIGPILASIINRFHKGDRSTLWAWTLVAWVCIGSHLFLDLLTSYGTQILRPFSNIPYSLNAIFIIDPFYTIPFVVLFVAALFAKKIQNVVRFSAAGLLISSLYLFVSFGIKSYMHHAFVQSAKEQGITYSQFVTSPEPLQILLRKGMLVNSGTIYQGWHSVLDKSSRITFTSVSRNPELLEFMIGDPLVDTLIRRSRGYYTASGGTGGVVYLNDMRFGTINGWANTGDTFVYSYALMHVGSGVSLLPWSRNFGRNIDANAFGVLLDRIGGI